MKKKLKYLNRIIHAYIIKRHDSNLTFWHTPLQINKLDDCDLFNVRNYPMNFVTKTTFQNHYDNEGSIMLNYYGALGLQYNPNAVAQLALGYYDQYLDKQDQKMLDAFLIQTDYFLKHGRIVKDDVLLWEYKFPFEMRNHLSAPWRSALAQGQAISVLIRAHQLTGDERYAQSAHQGYRAFYYKARDHEGGVLDDQDGFIWLEEYIVKPPNHVLNGFIWALWGVRDYAVYFENSHAQNLWEECLKTLEANLKNYDIGFWTSYDWTQGYDGDLPIMPSSLYYQELHSIQMLGMYNLTGNKLYLDYYEKWSSYLQSYWKRVISQTWKIYFKVRYF